MIIQTYNPEHYAIVNASNQDFEAFAGEELSYRKRLHYPPYSRLARMLYLGVDLQQLQSFMHVLEPVCQQAQDSQTQILGPNPAPFARINQQFRYHIIIKSASAGRCKEIIQAIQNANKCPKGISLQIDVDPASLF